MLWIQETVMPRSVSGYPRGSHKEAVTSGRGEERLEVMMLHLPQEVSDQLATNTVQ